jgi:hypothetical protein
VVGIPGTLGMYTVELLMAGTSGVVDMLGFELAGHLDLDEVSGTTGTWTVVEVAEGSSGIV